MRIRTLSSLLSGLLLAVPLLANDQAFQDGHPDEYTVQRGDTLWDIADRFLDTPWVWPEIWHINPDIDDPHLIYPGDLIRLVYIDGEPRLTVERDLREVRLSPEVREEELEPPISTIPMEHIRPFLSRNRVLDQETLDNAGYIIAGEDERVMAARGDNVYVRSLPDNERSLYTVVRKGDPYVDPESEEVLGFEAVYRGDVEKVADGDPATTRITSSDREILPGDLLIATPRETLRTEFQPQTPDADIEGYIIDVMDGVSQIGQFDVVVLNKGTDDGLAEGDVLAMYKAGREVRDRRTGEDVTLPQERGGELIVFRTYDDLSFGLVMHATRAMNVMDVVRNP